MNVISCIGGDTVEEYYEQIYDDVFSNIKKGNIDVFLCGAASTKKKTSYRDLLRNELKNAKRVSILYPEDLFMELLNRKKYDLLTLEKLLATNSDYIVIVCESPGSFTELGAFVNNSETVDKVIVLLQTKYKNAKSFIRQGPVEYVRSKEKSHVIYYNADILEASEKIKKILYNKNNSGKKQKDSFKDLNIISGQYNFVLLLLYFYKTLTVKKLVSYIKSVYEAKEFDMSDFDMIYTAAIRRLFKEGLIKKYNSDNDTGYMLTDKGYDSAMALLSYVELKGKTKIFDRIRMKILFSEDKD